MIKFQMSCNNLIFISIIIILQSFLCYSIHSKDVSSADLKKIIDLHQNFLLEIQTDSKKTNKTTSDSGNSKNTTTINKKSEKNSNDSKDKSPNNNNKTLNDLDGAGKSQSVIIENVKKLVTKVDKISAEMNTSLKFNKKILKNVNELKQVYKDLNYKISINSIKTEAKLNDVNKKLSSQLKNQLNMELYNVENKIGDLNDEIKKLDSKIKEIKAQLPDINNACSMYNSCVSCTSGPGCGWCSVSSRCVPGSSEGPNDGSCTFFEFGSCSGPKDCDSYKDCDLCIKDISCGWCDTTGTSKCMKRDDGDSKCPDTKFIHLWNSRNVCPHININNFENKLLKQLESYIPIDNKPQKNPLDIEPEERNKLTNELNFYIKEKNRKEVDLKHLLTALNVTQTEIAHLDNEKETANFNITAIKNSTRDFYDLSKVVFESLRDYIREFNRLGGNLNNLPNPKSKKLDEGNVKEIDNKKNKSNSNNKNITANGNHSNTTTNSNKTSKAKKTGNKTKSEIHKSNNNTYNDKNKTDNKHDNSSRKHKQINNTKSNLTSNSKNKKVSKLKNSSKSNSTSNHSSLNKTHKANNSSISKGNKNKTKNTKTKTNTTSKSKVKSDKEKKNKSIKPNSTNSLSDNNHNHNGMSVNSTLNTTNTPTKKKESANNNKSNNTSTNSSSKKNKTTKNKQNKSIQTLMDISLEFDVGPTTFKNSFAQIEAKYSNIKRDKSNLRRRQSSIIL